MSKWCSHIPMWILILLDHRVFHVNPFHRCASLQVDPIISTSARSSISFFWTVFLFVGFFLGLFCLSLLFLVFSLSYLFCHPLLHYALIICLHHVHIYVVLYSCQLAFPCCSCMICCCMFYVWSMHHHLHASPPLLLFLSFSKCHLPSSINVQLCLNILSPCYLPLYQISALSKLFWLGFKMAQVWIQFKLELF